MNWIFEVTSFFYLISRLIGVILNLHQELGRRPSQPAYPGKVETRNADVALFRATKRVDPPLGGFLAFGFAQSSTSK